MGKIKGSRSYRTDRDKDTCNSMGLSLKQEIGTLRNVLLAF